MLRSGAVLVGVLALVVGCASEPDDPATGDAGARLACGHFANVRQDIVDGVLTPAETREKLQEVNEDARASETPGVAEGARQMLAGLTQGDTDLMREGIVTFSQACSNVEPL